MPIVLARRYDWSPAVGTALTAGYRWLSVYCPGCRQVAAVDLERIDRHPRATLTSLILSLRCQQCEGGAPCPSCAASRTCRRISSRFRGTSRASVVSLALLIIAALPTCLERCHRFVAARGKTVVRACAAALVKLDRPHPGGLFRASNIRPKDATDTVLAIMHVVVAPGPLAGRA